jgi:hypothetical protein
MWGVVTSSLVIGWTLLFLNNNYTTYHARNYPGFSVGPAALAELSAAGRGDEIVVEGSLAKDGSKMANARVVRLADGRRVFAGSSGGDTPPK